MRWASLSAMLASPSHSLAYPSLASSLSLSYSISLSHSIPSSLSHQFVQQRKVATCTYVTQRWRTILVLHARNFSAVEFRNNKRHSVAFMIIFNRCKSLWGIDDVVIQFEKYRSSVNTEVKVIRAYCSLS